MTDRPHFRFELFPDAVSIGGTPIVVRIHAISSSKSSLLGDDDDHDGDAMVEKVSRHRAFRGLDAGDNFPTPNWI